MSKAKEVLKDIGKEVGNEAKEQGTNALLKVVGMIFTLGIPALVRRIRKRRAEREAREAAKK